MARADRLAGVILLAEAAVIAAIALGTGTGALLAVTFLGRSVASVNVAAAAVVLLAFCGILRLIPRDTRFVEFSQVSGITVFLVAQLNGVTEVTSLVPLYAIGAGATLFLVLHDRDGDRWAYSFGAAVGIVPWGVIAFAQIGAGVLGDSPTLIVRVVTLGILVLTGAEWAVSRLARTRPERIGLRTGAVLGAVTPSVFAWLALFA